MRFALLASAMLLAAPAAAQSFGKYTPAPQYDGGITTSVYIPMRDGVRLAVSITRPTNGGKPVEGKFPVLWTHTLGIPGPGPLVLPDPARATGYGGINGMVREGYVIVQVARRGNGPSFGKRRGYNDRSEAYDAYEVIDWLAAQPWSTGNVGIFGCSNTGDAAMHAVTAGNPHLKAAWAGCFSWEKYEGFLRGGIFANWGTGPERTLEQDLNNVPVQGDEAKTLLGQAAREHQGAYPLTKMWGEMPYRDSWTDATASRFWYEGSVATYLPQFQRSNVAFYIQGGWNDDLRNQNLVAYANIVGDKRIIIGPWTHCGTEGFDMISEVRRFFDQKLKGVDTKLAQDDPIHYFTTNAPAGQEWRSSKVWPVVGMQQKRFHLTGASGLSEAAPRGSSKPVNFTVRYDVECPTRPQLPGGLLTGALPCPVPQGGPSFSTTPLKADTEVTGDPIADLWITSTATDGNVFVYLEDVAPDGKITPITDARLKASLRKLNTPSYENYGLPWHRSHAEDAQPLKPGEPAQMTFTFLPTSYVFKAGHRIRFSLAGADFRERDRTPVTPAPQLALLNDAAHPSAIVLPIVGARGN